MTLETLETLEDVVRAGLDVVEVIVQDEFTHDVVVASPGARDDKFLVLDTT